MESVSIGGYTSNHNRPPAIYAGLGSVSIGGYTSNHNDMRTARTAERSVSIGGYTSNHNDIIPQQKNMEVFLLAVIHQTTTSRGIA